MPEDFEDLLGTFGRPIDLLIGLSGGFLGLSPEEVARMTRRIYAEHGAPFGPHEEAVGIWWEFEQYTTPD